MNIQPPPRHRVRMLALLLLCCCCCCCCCRCCCCSCDILVVILLVFFYCFNWQLLLFLNCMVIQPPPPHRVRMLVFFAAVVVVVVLSLFPSPTQSTHVGVFLLLLFLLLLLLLWWLFLWYSCSRSYGVVVLLDGCYCSWALCMRDGRSHQRPQPDPSWLNKHLKLRQTRVDSSLWPRGAVPELPSGTKGCKNVSICPTLRWILCAPTLAPPQHPL